MDASDQGSNGIHANEPFDDDLLSSYLPEISDIYEESVLLPRVGEQYQVEIPPMETKPEVSQIRPISYDDAKMSASDRYGIGLAISLKWILYAGDNFEIKCEKEELSNECNFHSTEGSVHLHNITQVNYKVSTGGSAPENPNLTACSANHEIQDNGQKDYCLSFLPRRKAGGFHPLPGLPTLSLSDLEEQSFLLGLYIFGKNLVQVKNFMATKRMGDVLSFYYGKFYRSDAYRRLSECRKIKNKRSIHGQRIFTGWRQQELLSRLLNTTPKDLQDTLLEAAKIFNEGRATLEEFVFRLKAAVGLQALVEAIGIGKGTYDLTVVALDHVKANQPVPLNPEIPVGRACSSLTSADIIKFLTGDFRLSKARSNDLFWEAVWPRLLARGWHSEQPKDHGSLRVKNALVFLVPGVKKFSKKKLVKGNQFFDSVSDVLSKVASDPTLLEFDIEGVKDCSSVKEENGWGVDAKTHRNGSSNHQRLSYMHPRLPNCNSDCMKFTVVDTSLVQREGSFRVMEVKSLPSDSPSNYVPSAYSVESGGDNSSELQDSNGSSADEEGSNLISFFEKKSEVTASTQSELSKSLKPLPGTTNVYAPGYKGLVKLKDDKTVEIRYQNGRRVKSSQTNDSAPALKRRKLTTCNREYDTNAFAKSVRRDKKKMRLKPVLLKAADSSNIDAASLVQEKTNIYPNTNGPENSITGWANPPDHKSQSQTLIDLNNLPPDADFTESTSNEFKAEDPSKSSVRNKLAGNQASMQYYSDTPVDEQPSGGLRRQSTRNRPPTAKALEALASGLLGTKRSWRSSASSSRPSRKAKKVYEEPASAAGADPANLASSTLSTSAAETISKDYEKSVRKGTHELLGVP